MPAHILNLTPMSDKPLPPYTRESVAKSLEQRERDIEWAARQVHAATEAKKAGAPQQLIDLLIIDGPDAVIGWVQAYVLHLGWREL